MNQLKNSCSDCIYSDLPNAFFNVFIKNLKQLNNCNVDTVFNSKSLEGILTKEGHFEETFFEERHLGEGHLEEGHLGEGHLRRRAL